MSWGPDWNWIGYMNSFDDETNNGAGGGGNHGSVKVFFPFRDAF